MGQLMTIEEFVQLNIAERNEYMLEQLELEDFWVLGYVQNTVEDKPFFFINDVINPYTTKNLKANVFAGRSMTTQVFCNLPEEASRFEDDAFVAVKVRVNSNPKKLEDRKLLTSNYKDVYEIETPEKVQQLLEKSPLDLPIYALSKPSYQVHSDEDFVNVTELIGTYGEQERAAISTHEELERAKTAEALQQLQKLEATIAQERAQLRKEEQKIDEQQKSIRTMTAALAQLGFSVDGQQQKQDSSTPLPLPAKGSELVKGVQQQLAVRGYQYEERFVRQLLATLHTGQMLVLMGPSGTGKTTIVRQLADVVGADCEIIPVQPSWTDKQDLLGFYNPIRKLFVPSAFLDCLIKAKSNPNKLFFICLDEMNLAQIEYYLADVLSIREVPEEKLRLYSDFEYEQNMEEIGWFIQHMLQSELPLAEAMEKLDVNSMQHFDMITRYKNMQRYTAQMDIPENVRIIGTMNVDGSVQTISPKIIDRAFIIPVMKQQANVKIDDVEKGHYALHFNVTEASTISTVLQGELNKMYDKLEKLSITYNDRVEKHVKQYYHAASQFDVNTKQLLDDVALMKLYPRIHAMLAETDVRAFVEQMMTQIGEESAAATKLTHMQTRMQETGLFSYWS